MSIVGVAEINGTVLAVSDRGQLIIWNLAQKLVHGKFVFENNVSLLPSQSKIQVNPQSLQGIILFAQNIFMYSKNTVYLTNINKLLANSIQNKFKPQLQINCTIFLQNKEIINCLAVVDAYTILLGTNTGNLLKYNLIQNTVQLKLDFDRKISTEDSELLMFSTAQKHHTQITSVSLYSQDSLALVTTSAGKVYSVSLANLQIVYQLTSSYKQPLQSIRKLVLTQDKDKFYCLHQNYVTLWSIQLNSCLQYYEYAHPQSVLKFKDQLLIAGPHSTLLCFNQISKQVALSMRSARVLTQIGESLVAVGGSECLIDVLQGEARLMTLFKN